MSVQLDAMPELLTAVEAQQLLRVSRNQIYILIKKGVVPHTKLGSKILIPRDGLRRLVSAGTGWANGDEELHQ